MLAALALGDDQLAADELDRLVVVEGAEVDEPLVLHASPAAKRERRLLHDGSVASGTSLVNRRRFDTLPAVKFIGDRLRRKEDPRLVQGSVAGVVTFADISEAAPAADRAAARGAARVVAPSGA